MINNTSNGAYLGTTPTNTEYRSGCLALVKNWNYDLCVLVKEQDIKNFCDETELTLDEIISRMMVLGFNSPNYEMVGKNYVFTLLVSQYKHQNKRRYYAFCILRHLFYYQKVLLQFLKDFDKFSTDMERVKYYSFLNLNEGYGLTCGLIFPHDKRSLDEIINDFVSKNDNCVSYPDLRGRPMATSVRYNKKSYEDYINIITKDIPFLTDPNLHVYLLGSTGSHNTIKYIKENYPNTHVQNGIVFSIGPISEFSKTENVAGGYCSTYNCINITLTNVATIVKVFQSRINRYPVDIRSRHPSHDVFRNIMRGERNVLIRFGSKNKSTKKYDLEINKIEAIENSSNKLFMKQCFQEADVSTPRYYTYANLSSDVKFPIIAKNIFGSRNTGNYKLDDEKSLTKFLRSRRNLDNYIFEEFANYAKEYRVHVTKNGAFLTWRKLRRRDTTEQDMWFFNNQNCVWISENNPLFDAPNNLKAIHAECVKALNSVGLDFGALDVRVKSNTNLEGKNRKNPKFAIIEINSAPSMAPETTKAYIKMFKREFNLCVD